MCAVFALLLALLFIMMITVVLCEDGEDGRVLYKYSYVGYLGVVQRRILIVYS